MKCDRRHIPQLMVDGDALHKARVGGDQDGDLVVGKVIFKGKQVERDALAGRGHPLSLIHI